MQILDCSGAAGGRPVGGGVPALRFAHPQQVIEVPMISSSSRRSRRMLTEPQTAEQLVEVPTDTAYVVLVFASTVLGGGLQGFIP